MDQLAAMFGTGALISFLLENLKRASWFPWLSYESSKVNSAAAFVLAFFSTIGLQYMWDDTTRVLSVTVPTLSGFLTLLWQFGVQWAIQKFVYRTGVKEPQPVAITAVP